MLASNASNAHCEASSSSSDVTIETSSLPKLTRSSIWFSDGNIVLISFERIAFKVHRGQLDRHSEIFAAIFELPQPSEGMKIDGTDCLEVQDSASDLFHFLNALYDGLYYTYPRSLQFPAIAGILRLATKYFVSHLRDRCLHRLRLDWPSTLADWDMREQEATDDKGKYSPRPHFPHPILIIELAIQLDLKYLLPAAFYDLSRYAPSRVASGLVKAPPQTGVLDQYTTSDEESSSPEDTPTITHLDNMALFHTLQGRERGQRFLANFILAITEFSPDTPCLAKRDRKSGRPACAQSFYFVTLNLLRAVGGIASGRDGDPLFTLLQAIDMLNRADFSDGTTTETRLAVCSACRISFEQRCHDARKEAWESILSWFGLPDDCGPQEESVVEDEEDQLEGEAEYDALQ